MIHLGKHDHPMVEGHYRENFKQIKSLVEHKVSWTPRATTSTIALVVNNLFFSKHLLNEDGEGLVEVLKGNKLHQMMDMFIALFLPNVWNFLAPFKHRPRNRWYIFSILAFN
jgi:hypothetical protein